MKPIRLYTCAALLIASSTMHAATSIAGFGDGSAFTFNKNSGTDASISAGALTLTTASGSQARTVFATAKQDITSFTTTFRYENGNSATGADGFFFVIQNAGINALGGSGGDRGFAGGGGNGGTPIANSLGIGFNIYNNDNTSVGSNGSIENLLAKQDTSPITLLNLVDVTITYNGTNLSYTVTNVNNAAETFTRNVDVDIPTIVGDNTAFVGFTGGTGGAVATQTISDFSFASPVPEPSAALLGAMGALALLRRRRA